MRAGNEAGFELRRCEINAALETGMEKLGELFQVAPFRAGKIDNRPGGKEQTEHRTDAMKRDVDLCVCDRGAGEFFESAAEMLENFPSIESIELTSMRNTGSHGERIYR